MSALVVRSQAEWDALPAEFAEFTIVEIRAHANAPITVNKIPKNGHAELRESSHAELWGSSHAVLRESSHAVLRESSHAELRESSHAVLRESSHAELRESSHAVLWESSHAVLRESSHAVLRESSHAVLWGSSHAELRESSHAVLWESSHAVLRESSHAELWGSSHAELWGSSHAELRESSHAELRESSHAVLRGRSSAHQRSTKSPNLHGQSVCFLYDGAGVPLRKSDNATIIQVASPQGVPGWLEENGVVDIAGEVILYKRVSGGFLTQEGEPWQTTWVIGEVKEHPAWEPTSGECGAGKFHACSRPYFCDEFRSVAGDRYIALKIAVEDLYAWPNADYPHKISFRRGVVMHEVDRWGDKIETAAEAIA